MKLINALLVLSLKDLILIKEMDLMIIKII
jgi:hypothetical protein